MLRFHDPFNGKRFIGDNRLKVFHDSLYESLPLGSSKCKIERIPFEEIRTFEPDSENGAWGRGFVHCPYCRQSQAQIKVPGAQAE